MTTNAFPPGGTYFDSAKRNFTSVPINKSQDNAISTTEFLEASESLTGLFDVLGSVAFKPVASDMTVNIKVGLMKDVLLDQYTYGRDEVLSIVTEDSRPTASFATRFRVITRFGEK